MAAMIGKQMPASTAIVLLLPIFFAELKQIGIVMAHMTSNTTISIGVILWLFIFDKIKLPSEGALSTKKPIAQVRVFGPPYRFQYGLGRQPHVMGSLSSKDLLQCHAGYCYLV